MGTSRLKPATRAGTSAQRLEDRRDQPLIRPDEHADQEHRGERMALRCASCSHSAVSASKLAREAFCLAIRTIHQPRCSSGRTARTTSRNLRRTRLRITAPPTRREVMKPIRVSVSVSAFKTLRTISLPWNDKPSRLSLANSPARLSRADLGKDRRAVGILDFDPGFPISAGPAGRPQPSIADRESKMIRPACDGRNGSRRPLAAAACGLVAGDARGWRDHSSSSCGRENRTAACACAWRVDRCVS